MIGAGDWATFFGDDFAEAVTLIAPNGPRVDIRGIFTAAGSTVAVDDFGGGVSTVLPTLAAPASALPDWLTPDRDEVVAGGNRYTLRKVVPDGTGLSRLILERVF